MQHWYHTPAITLAPTNLGRDWQAGLENAMRNWNNSATPITVRFCPNSRNMAVAQRRNLDNRGWFGVFQGREFSGGYLRRFEIRIYTDRIGEHIQFERPYTAVEVATSVWTHELGHAVGLGDNPSRAVRPNDSLMNGDRSRRTVQAPMPFDRQSANWLHR